MFTQIGIFASQLDYDAINFCSTAGITNQTHVLALQYLVSNLKIAGIWTKCKAIYPFVGGTASTHKWNLKDPRDVDAAFRLSILGSWTHSSTGALPDGSSGYANTFLNPKTNLTNAGLIHMSYYSRTNSAFSTEVVMGCTDGSGGTALVCRRSNDLLYFQHDVLTGNSTRIAGSTTTTNGSGFFVGNLTSADIFIDRNGVSQTLSKVNNRNIDRQNQPLFLAARNNAGSADLVTNKECAFASIGDSLTAQERSDFWTVVNQYQTILGRNV